MQKKSNFPTSYKMKKLICCPLSIVKTTLKSFAKKSILVHMLFCWLHMPSWSCWSLWLKRQGCYKQENYAILIRKDKTCRHFCVSLIMDRLELMNFYMMRWALKMLTKSVLGWQLRHLSFKAREQDLDDMAGFTGCAKSSSSESPQLKKFAGWLMFSSQFEWPPNVLLTALLARTCLHEWFIVDEVFL